MGKGEGSGAGSGAGSGGDDENVILGGAVVGVVVVVFCVIGLPMIIAGVVMIVFFNWGAGIQIGGYVLIGIASALLVAGIVIGILICVGAISTKTTRNRTGPITTTTTATVIHGNPAYAIPAPPYGMAPAYGYGQPGLPTGGVPPAYDNPGLQTGGVPPPTYAPQGYGTGQPPPYPMGHPAPPQASASAPAAPPPSADIYNSQQKLY